MKPTHELLKTLYLYNTFGAGDGKLMVTQVKVDFWYKASHRDLSGLMGPERLSAAYEKLESRKQGKQ